MQSEVKNLPPELKQMLLKYLPKDLQNICIQGHIIITKDQEILLTSGLEVKILAMGAGGGGVSLKYLNISLSIIYLSHSMVEAEEVRAF